MKLDYDFLNIGFSANVENKADGIEISDVQETKGTSQGLYKYESAESILNHLLIPFVKPYSKIIPSTREGKQALKEQLFQDVEKLEQEIAKKKMAIKMCQRNKVYFKK